MAGKVEQLVESVTQYAEILLQCSRPDVANWKVEDLDRAFNWARYFHKVHSKVAERPAVIRTVNRKLSQVGHQRGMRFGGEELSLGFLAASSEYLLKLLLENPALPSALRDSILQEHASSPGLQLHMQACDSDVGLLQTLTAVHSKLCDNGLVAQGSGIRDTEAKFLLDHLQWLLNSGLKEEFHKQLKTFSQSGMAVILAILCRPSTDSTEAAEGAVLQWLMDIVQSKQEEGCAVWREDNALLAQVCTQQKLFYEAYVQHLLREGGQLQGEVEVEATRLNQNFEITDGKFEKLSARFSALLTSVSDASREFCLAAIRERTGGEFEHRMTAALGRSGPSFVWIKLYQRVQHIVVAVTS